MNAFQTLFIIVAISYQAHSQEKRDDTLFQKIGTYTLGDIEKTLWVPHHIEAQWYLTRPICKAHGLDILTIKTLYEANRVALICGEHKELFSVFVHIGGATKVGRSRGHWYWITTNEKFSRDLPWGDGEPNHVDNREFCLSMKRDDAFKFNDIPCSGGWDGKFICESVRCLGVKENSCN